MNMNKDPLVSPTVGEALKKAKDNLFRLASSFPKDSSLPGLSKGLEGSGIESHAGIMSADEKMNLFDGSALKHFESITDSLSGVSAQASVITSVLSFVPGVGKLNSFINNIADPLLRMGDGGAKLLTNLRDASAMVKENIVERLQEGFAEYDGLLENDGGFSELDDVEQRLALEMLIDQEEGAIQKMMASLDYDEATGVSEMGASSLFSQIGAAAKYAMEADFSTNGLTLVPGLG